MNEQNKNSQPREEAPKTAQGEPAVTSSSWKRMLSKRWVFPAAYLAAAAIILTLVWVYQDASQKPLKQQAAVTEAQKGTDAKTATGGKKEEAVEVIANSQSMIWPTADGAEATVVKPFYDAKAPAEQHQEAMVQYNDTFTPNLGIDLARKDDKAFDVTAALDGKVTRVEDHPVNGTVVEITHPGELKTVYQSLSGVKVEQGKEVKQGETIASAGHSEFEKDLGNHVHFEVYDGENLVNPMELLPKN
ncbi:M23 family metallopeptidase [Paenibacillus sp. N3/727]|uniref:M23 family metallopeptidase n=1 Tax=Paenibacillus sp. N3/727 TaxID=2925845 RepID=UPI001F53836C|nr:M23 family metallopeptidase [Paenibacillus sp. N3/727]UNK18099.1 M23 family metallopeptidase [Paenibacillus sp. N3/727]